LVRAQDIAVKRSATYLLLEVKLGEPLADFVTRLRDDERPWSYIGRKLREATSNTVSFSDEALRKWFSTDECSERAA
jgi:hypothetical protein